MRFGVVSDVHSNWQALQAVAEDGRAQGVQAWISLGDTVGYNADPDRALRWTREHCQQVLAGNHCRAAVDPEMLGWFRHVAVDAMRHTIGRLTADELEWLRRLPWAGARNQTLLFHGSPRDPDEYVTPETVYPNLKALEGRTAFHGHSHIGGVFILSGSALLIAGEHVNFGHGTHDGSLILGEGQSTLVNPGSVGQPRDGDPRASYGVWEDGERKFTFRRVAYDIEAAQGAIRAAGLPDSLADRLAVGR